MHCCAPTSGEQLVGECVRTRDALGFPTHLRRSEIRAVRRIDVVAIKESLRKRTLQRSVEQAPGRPRRWQRIAELVELSLELSGRGLRQMGDRIIGLTIWHTASAA